MSLDNKKGIKNIYNRLKIENVDYGTITFCVGEGDDKQVKTAKFLKVKFEGESDFTPIRESLKCDCEIPQKVQAWFDKRSVGIENKQLKEDIASIDYYFKFMESMSDLE